MPFSRASINSPARTCDWQAVKDEPINLKVLRHDQDDMTLVDLPGITRVAREGQGSDGKQLEGMILRMCRRYAEPPESIILNVASAQTCTAMV